MPGAAVGRRRRRDRGPRVRRQDEAVRRWRLPSDQRQADRALARPGPSAGRPRLEARPGHHLRLSLCDQGPGPGRLNQGCVPRREEGRGRRTHSAARRVRRRRWDDGQKGAGLLPLRIQADRRRCQYPYRPAAQDRVQGLHRRPAGVHHQGAMAQMGRRGGDLLQPVRAPARSQRGRAAAGVPARADPGDRRDQGDARAADRPADRQCEGRGRRLCLWPGNLDGPAPAAAGGRFDQHPGGLAQQRRDLLHRRELPDPDQPVALRRRSRRGGPGQGPAAPLRRLPRCGRAVLGHLG